MKTSSKSGLGTAGRSSNWPQGQTLQQTSKPTLSRFSCRSAASNRISRKILLPQSGS